jgi:hypothetical protein
MDLNPTAMVLLVPSSVKAFDGCLIPLLREHTLVV